MGKCSLIIRKMHNEATMRYYLLPWGREKKIKSDNIKCQEDVKVRMQSNEHLHTLLWGANTATLLKTITEYYLVKLNLYTHISEYSQRYRHSQTDRQTEAHTHTHTLKGNACLCLPSIWSRIFTVNFYRGECTNGLWVTQWNVMCLHINMVKSKI